MSKQFSFYLQEQNSIIIDISFWTGSGAVPGPEVAHGPGVWDPQPRRCGENGSKLMFKVCLKDKFYSRNVTHTCTGGDNPRALQESGRNVE